MYRAREENGRGHVTEVTVSGDAITQTMSRTYMFRCVLKFDWNRPAFEVTCAESR